MLRRKGDGGSPECFKNDNIIYIGDLVRRTEAEMLRAPTPGHARAGFGRKSLNEEVLSSMGLRLGMDIPGWPVLPGAMLRNRHSSGQAPENIEEMAKKLEQELLG